MIESQKLRKKARELHLDLALVEKDYALGWILFGVAKSTISQQIIFKGGTALSKIYYPYGWRLSEDLDFTVEDNKLWTNIKKSLSKEIPDIIWSSSGISVKVNGKMFSNPNYLQCKFQYVGPISRNTVKIEFTRELFVGDIVTKNVPRVYDYEEFEVKVYSLENILAEKLRTLIERGYARDYYDVWRLISSNKFNGDNVKQLFLDKCKGKNIVYSGVNQFFPQNLDNELDVYYKNNLTRLTSEPLPLLKTLIEESQTILSKIL